MGKRHIRIAELLNEAPGQSVVAKGWVRTKRGNKNIAFIALNDGSTINNIQIVVDKTAENEAVLAKKKIESIKEVFDCCNRLEMICNDPEGQLEQLTAVCRRLEFLLSLAGKNEPVYMQNMYDFVRKVLNQTNQLKASLEQFTVLAESMKNGKELEIDKMIEEMSGLANGKKAAILSAKLEGMLPLLLAVSRAEKQLNERMEKAGFPIFLYASFRKYNAPESGILIDIFDPRYSEGYAAVRNRLGLLIENHIYKPYDQRVKATVEAFIASARILKENKHTLKEVIDNADKVVSAPEYRRNPMDMAFQPVDKDSVWVDYLSWARDTVKSDLSGGDWVRHNYEKPITLRCPMITSYEPTLSVQLPEAYILMPQWTEVISLLDLHGINYTRLVEPKQVEVETYRYTNAVFSSRQSEGRIPVVKSEYTTQKELLEYPAGSILIDMNQPSGRLAAWLLEPSAPGSLVYWGFFNQVVQPTHEFWIRPQYMEVKGRELLAKDPELRAEFEKKKLDLSFAQNPQAILDFFYQKVKKKAHQNNELHPAWRIMDRNQIF